MCGVEPMLAGLMYVKSSWVWWLRRKRDLARMGVGLR
jgi:hypothetical protein